MDLVMFSLVAVVAARLTQDARELRRLASTDDLTGLHNLRSFESLCRELIERQRLANGSVGMIALDVDRLKQLNDTYGHLTGADAVKHVGEVLARVLPMGGHACRYGGDEFAVVVADASSVQTAELAGRIQCAIADSGPVLDGTPFPAGALAVSVGCASADIGAAGPAAAIFARLFRQADDAMYENKRCRRFSLDGASIQTDPLLLAKDTRWTARASPDQAIDAACGGFRVVDGDGELLARTQSEP
jgi:diguanylate cyclase (GGDEF)-like protein